MGPRGKGVRGRTSVDYRAEESKTLKHRSHPSVFTPGVTLKTCVLLYLNTIIEFYSTLDKCSITDDVVIKYCNFTVHYLSMIDVAVSQQLMFDIF